jgi:hypothetical protein
MKRLLIAAMLLDLVACGPSMSAAEGGSTDGTSEDDAEQDTDTTEEGETGSEPTECYGGEPLGLDLGRIWAVNGDDEYWDGSTVRSLDCVVASVEAPHKQWRIGLACEDGDVSIDFQWYVLMDYGLVDESWVGKSLSVDASGRYNWSWEGWAVLRDEQGELVWISADFRVPEPEWTDPISIEVLELGKECVASSNECAPKYSHVVLFDSPVDGELRSYRGGGHQTEHFTYIGISTTFADPFGSDCPDPGEHPIETGRRDFAWVVRRP